MADLTSLFVPSTEIGLIPIPTVLGNLILLNLSLKCSLIRSLMTSLSFDPFSNSTSGTVRIVALQSIDTAVRHAVSFCSAS